MSQAQEEKEPSESPPGDELFDVVCETVDEIQVLLDRLKSVIGE